MLRQGKLRKAVRWVAGRVKVGLSLLSGMDTNMGKLVADVLLSKNMNPTKPSEEIFHLYDFMPTLIDWDIISDISKPVINTTQVAVVPG